MAKKDVTDLIERLEAFEDRSNVTLEGLFAQVDKNGYVRVNGELHPRDGTELDQDIEVVATVYDSSGRVLAVANHRFHRDEFFGFEAFGLFLASSNNRPAKIRVYPKTR